MDACMYNVVLTSSDNKTVEVIVDKNVMERLTTDNAFKEEYFKLMFPNHENKENKDLNTNEASVSANNKESKSDSENVWTSFAVKKLIEIRKEMDTLFEKPNCKKVKLWGDASVKLKKEGVNVGAVECDRKWRNLILTYRRRKDQMRKSGSGRLPFWEFHEDFDHFFGLKANVSPPPETLLASTFEKRAVPAPPLSSPPPSPSPPLSSPPPPPPPSSSSSPPRKKKKSSSEPPEWFLNFMKKQEELEEKRWKKLEDIENEKLKILKEILNIVKKN